MTETAGFPEPAFILHSLPYRETSLLLDTFTYETGRLTLLAKGVRKAKSKWLGLLRPFAPLSLSYMGKSELKTLIGLEALAPAFELKGIALYSAYYLNDLIRHLVMQYEAVPNLFQYYYDCLKDLGKPDSLIEPALRNFEFNLLDTLGYGINLQTEADNRKFIANDKYYQFDNLHGFVENNHGSFKGAELLAMQKRHFIDNHVLNQAKKLLRIVIDHHLQGKTLQSRQVLNQLFKTL